MTDDWAEALNANELHEGEMKKVSLGGQELLIARVGDRYYCAQNRCPHLGGDLSRGMLEGTVITCPNHHSQFDLTDGHVIRWTSFSGFALTLAKSVKPPRSIVVYPVRIEGDKVLVGQ
jgi:3-phenylpropionate/trans-cinnamate dioxygenase ferredoxin subunit